MLLNDPRFELRLAAQGVPQAGEVVGKRNVGDHAVKMVDSLAANVPDSSASELTSKDLVAASGVIATSEELRQAALAVGNAADARLVQAVARAIVAQALAAYREDPPGPMPAGAMNAGIRDELVQRIAAALAPAGVPKAVPTWLIHGVVEFLKPLGTNYGRTHRDALTVASAAGAADILYYQRRGDAIARYLTEALANLDRPVVAVGHSLGGVLLADVLSQNPAPQVDLLVTVGSQPSLFYAVDALQHLRPGGDKAPFTPWLNFYDRSDFLSYTATDVFARFGGIEDVELDSGVPFPDSHGAYWYDDRLYQRVKSAWPG
jgi:hypothetical protein